MPSSAFMAIRYFGRVSARHRGRRSSLAGARLVASFLLTSAALAGCTSRMRVHTGNPTARVFINGQPRGVGTDVLVQETVGAKETFEIEARVTPDCRGRSLVESRQSIGRIFGCLSGSMLGGAAGGTVGVGTGGAISGAGAQGADFGYGALSGVAVGALIGGIICSVRGYAAPAYVDVDVSHCMPTDSDGAATSR